MSNKIFLYGSEKGGVGKTSTSLNMAVMRARAGHKVLLVDADKQASASMWASMRSEGGYVPVVVCVQKLGRIGADLVHLSHDYEVIVDAGGADSQELRQAIAVADKWIIPVRTGQLDLFSMAKLAQLQLEVREKIGSAPDTMVLLNAVSPSTNEAAEARELLAENAHMPVLQSILVDRVAMRRAVMAGCAVVELPSRLSSSACVQELAQLYGEIFGEAYVDQN